MSVLAVLETRGAAWHPASMETLAAAQQIARELGVAVSAAVIGENARLLGCELARTAQLEVIYAFEHELLNAYTPDAYTAALEAHIDCFRPTLVLFPQTYQTRDYLPKLATRLERVAVPGVIAHRVENGALLVTRQICQGKVNAELRFVGEAPYLASIETGFYRADAVVRGASHVESVRPAIEPADIRTRPSAPFRSAPETIALDAAERIVAAGRGIGDAANLPLIEKLAAAFGAELAASRPICDAGWLPMERQVGSSGQTVAPKLYVAIGISGAVQHLMGMRGANTVVAINKDPDAPIFEIADYGIAGDLFQIVPALIEAVKK
jgi:electron transfer flavoprotein alpha subunit